jgi:hypothetical protein
MPTAKVDAPRGTGASAESAWRSDCAKKSATVTPALPLLPAAEHSTMQCALFNNRPG